MSYDATTVRRSPCNGYWLVRIPGHARANKSGYVREHIAVAEAAIGKSLTPGAVVHHVNGIKSDNRKENLVICQDEAYHKALHVRLRVSRAGGNPFSDRICATCRQVKPMSAFSPRKNGPLCRECKPCMVVRVVAYKRKKVA